MVKKLKTAAFIIIFITVIFQPFTLDLSAKNLTHTNNQENLHRKTIYVDDETQGPWEGTQEHPYRYIQDGLDKANDKDTIYVYNGTYHENIKINKPIRLIGENKNTTIIDGGGNTDTVTINADHVEINGFTIKNGSSKDKVEEWFRAGIRITDSNNTIHGNIISNNLLGIFGKQVTNITIYDNLFFNDGITFSPYGKEQTHPRLRKRYFIHNIKNNTVNGKPLLYCKNQKNMEIASNPGQIIAVNCTNINIKNTTLKNTDFEILFAFCSHCNIENSTLTSNDGELWLINSSNNIIKNNNISKNFHGICLDYNSKHNKIKNNLISKNKCMGVIIEEYSNHNHIKHNNFIKNNLSHAYFIQSFRNNWNKNYWDQHPGVKHKLLRFLPKTILGRAIENIPFPTWINFDWHPAEHPLRFK